MFKSDFFNYQIIPPVFLVFFTAAVQLLTTLGNPSRPFELNFLLGNAFAWKCIGTLVLWALVWLWIPSKKFEGPVTSFGLVPVYQANGELYYFASVFCLGSLLYFKPDLSVQIYSNMGSILGGLNLLAMGLCIFLLVKAKTAKNQKDPYLKSSNYPLLHEFYRGMELHPRLLGVDVKQLTNCRVGMIMWQLLILIHLTAATKIHGSLDYGLFVNVALQSIYIFKFYHWETGYFNTLDITLDRAGYYLCWGCLVWIPSFYAFSSYYFVYHSTQSGFFYSLAVFLMGLAAIYLNYEVDLQKELFRSTNGNCKVWGQKAQCLKVSYRQASNELKTTFLLTSGWWGQARKINYTFELMAAFLWCAPAGLTFGPWPYLYFLFLFGLLVHRVYRDEAKCQDKYGKGWTEYCSQVKYRLVPLIF